MQVWLAAILALAGVGCLELLAAGGDLGGPGIGDFWSVLQAVGFGTSFFLTEKMMAKNPSQALPITAMQVGTRVFFWLKLDLALPARCCVMDKGDVSGSVEFMSWW